MANFNFNKVILGGRLTSAPELKTTPNGTYVTNFSVAVNRRGKDQPTDFINCVAFKERAELIAKYFGKGSSICVVGEIQTRSWKDKDGNNRYATDVIVSEVNFVDSKADNAPASAPTYVPDAYKAPAETGYQELGKDDDLPF